MDRKRKKSELGQQRKANTVNVNRKTRRYVDIIRWIGRNMNV